MSRRGNCWDNAPQESFFGHMKDELADAIPAQKTFEGIKSSIDDWTDGDSQYAMDNLNRMKELNQAIEDLMQPYIHWVEDVLRVKCCYEKLLTDYLHIKHGFLTEADLAKQFASYFKTESMAAMAHRKLNGPAPLTSCHEVFTPEDGTPFLCASYDFDRYWRFSTGPEWLFSPVANTVFWGICGT